MIVHSIRLVFGPGLLEGSVMFRWIVPWALIRLGVAISIACLADCTQAQTPPASSTPVTQDARLIERDRLFNEAQRLRERGKTAEAIETARQVVAIEEKVFGTQHQELIGTWGFIADCAEDLENWSVAESACDNALRIAKLAYGENDWRTGDARRARQKTTQLQKLSREDRAALLQAKKANAQVLILYRAGKFTEGIAFARQAVESRERVLGPDHPDTAQGLNNLAVLYEAQGNFAAAEPLKLRVLKITEKALGPNHPHTAISLNNLAELYQVQGNYAAAEPLYERALAIKKKVLGPDHPDTAVSLNNLAELCQIQGNYAAAEPLYERALAIRQKALGPDHPDTAQGLNNLAALYRVQGNYAAAEPLYKRALSTWEKVLGPDHPNTALSLNNLAALYRVQGNYKAAEPLYQRALAIRQKALGPDHPDTAQGLNNLAALYKSEGNYAAAEPLYERALAICEKSLGPDHPNTAASLNNLAGLSESQGNYAAAEPFYERALAIKEKALGPDHPDTATSLNNRALLFWEMGRSGAARPLAGRGFDIHIRHLEQTAAIQTEQQQFLMAAKVSNHLNVWLTVTSEDVNGAGEAWRRVLAWKGLTTTRQIALRQTLKDDPTYAEFRRASQQLSTTSINPPLPPSDPRALAAWNERAPAVRRAWQGQKKQLEEEYQRLEKELAQKSALYRQDHQRQAVTPENIVDALRATPQPTALVDLIEYWYLGRKAKGETSEWRVAAFVIRPEGKIQRIELGPSKAIADEVALWRKTFGRPTEQHDPGSELRRLLWEPLAPSLADINTLLVSPDGALAQLPWGALPGNKLGTHLVEELSIAVIPVPQMLPEILQAKPWSGAPTSLLVAGDIEYGGDPGVPQDLLAQRGAVGRQRDGHWLQFTKLDNAQSELESIGNRYRKNVRAGNELELEGVDATETAFREKAPQYAWLHLITHGFFAPPEWSRRVSEATTQGPFAKPGEVSAMAKSKPAPINPGLLSGLVFAGANSPPEAGKDDGILTAIEVSALDLSKVDTVVLSACETGLGEVAGGEGLLGLQRSFQVAGAKTVVASLWKVPDAATSELMQRFYENLWDKRMGKLVALREAQLWMLHEGVKKPELWRGLNLVSADNLPMDKPTDATTGLPPFYWAAFVLSGDWR
jgi:CHAT domain-containing protein/Tfp pilus assembly protein PilF